MNGLLCNMYNGIYDTSCLNVVKLSTVLSAIKNGRWIEQITTLRECTAVGESKKLKSSLPAVTFCGVFEDAREDKNIVHYNNLMIVDIDGITPNKLKSLKAELKLNKHIFAYFVSPNFGLKILIPVSSDHNKHSTDAFYGIQELFKDAYGIEIDKSGKNVSRLCFISYDPELYLNEDAELFEVDSMPDTLEGFTKVFTARENYIPTQNVDTIFKTSIKMVKASKAGGYREGNRNNYIFVLSCLMCEFGVTYEQSLETIFNKYNTLGFPEVKNTVSSAFRRNKHNFATKTVNERRNNDQVNLGL